MSNLPGKSSAKFDSTDRATAGDARLLLNKGPTGGKAIVREKVERLGWATIRADVRMASAYWPILIWKLTGGGQAHRTRALRTQALGCSHTFHTSRKPRAIFPLSFPSPPRSRGRR